MPDPRELVAAMYLEFAEELADLAAAAIRPWFRNRATVETKGDGSPVTVADRSAEAEMRQRIADRFPQHGIIGEEFGTERDDAEWVWVLDPLDGTGAFVSGIPTFGTVIGLAREGEPVLGVLDSTILSERWTGLSFPDLPRKAAHNKQVIHSTSTTDLSASTCLATTPEMFQAEDLRAWQRLSARCERVRYGIDCYAYGLLALGTVDIVCEASLKLWDYFGLAPIVRGAGGQMTDWNGSALTLASGDQILATATPQLHRAALSELAASGGNIS